MENNIKKMEFLIFCLEMSYKTCRVWKRYCGINDKETEYNKGWNDCIKEQKKHEKAYIKDFKECTLEQLNKIINNGVSNL